ncbi:MAG TPA: hypothetical protein VLC06_21760 [Polyangia bacterium]|nr:hypothetical protein [Polyangia bacterium]
MREFTMSFEPMMIEHLGLRFYDTLPPVISEVIVRDWRHETGALLPIPRPAERPLTRIR